MIVDNSEYERCDENNNQNNNDHNNHNNRYNSVDISYQKIRTVMQQHVPHFAPIQLSDVQVRRSTRIAEMKQNALSDIVCYTLSSAHL